MINKTEQEVDNNIDQLINGQDEKFTHSIVIIVDESCKTKEMYYETKDKNGKIISKSTQPWHLQTNFI